MNEFNINHSRASNEEDFEEECLYEILEHIGWTEGGLPLHITKRIGVKGEVTEKTYPYNPNDER